MNISFKTFQFDPICSECFVSDESSEEAVPSAKLDLYEPFCSPETADVSCNRPYAYEKILTTKMVGASDLEVHSYIGPEHCLGLCSNLQGCRAVNYDVNKRTCHLLDRQRPQGAIGPDENFDFYEAACPSTTTTIFVPRTTEPPGDFHLISRGKTLSYSLRHISLTDVKGIEECYDRCKKAGFNCKTFSYSQKSESCILSGTVITGEPNQLQSEEGTNLYATGRSIDLK